MSNERGGRGKVSEGEGMSWLEVIRCVCVDVWWLCANECECVVVVCK